MRSRPVSFFTGLLMLLVLAAPTGAIIGGEVTPRFSDDGVETNRDYVEYVGELVRADRNDCRRRLRG